MTEQQPTPAQAAAAIGRALAALRPVFVHAMQTITAAFEALRPTIEYYQQHPEELKALRRDREAAARWEGCHCLCGLHRDRTGSVCAGKAEPGLTVTRHSPTVGTVHIPMCRPCHDAATLSSVGAGE